MNIYVGNLAYETTSEDLEASFGNYGQVESARVITDRYSGRSRGFGFVEMPDKDEAEAAIKGLNGTDLKGRALTVNESKPRARSDGGGGGGDRGYGGGRSERRW